MNNSETILSRLIEISSKNNCDLIEAAVIFCDEADISESDFIEKIDHHLIEQLKYSAIANGKVRKCVANLEKDIFA